MISQERLPVLSVIVKAFAPLTWRSREKIANKLAGFAATEAGSALDMLEAAELETDPRRRRLFFIHGIDEARHADLFRKASKDVLKGSEAELTTYQSQHAIPQHIYREWDRVDFLSFVYDAERKGQSHFASLGEHFKDHPTLGALFDSIEKDERFHVRYSKRLLTETAREEGQSVIRKSALRVKRKVLWQGWRRAGRRIGDIMAKVVLSFVYLFAVAPFAFIERRRASQCGLVSAKSISNDTQTFSQQY
jgi:hypothetical protein